MHDAVTLSCIASFLLTVVWQAHEWVNIGARSDRMA